MSKGTCKQITGRIIGINFEEKAIDVRPYKRLSDGIMGEPIRFYANNALFRDLVYIAKSAWSETKTGPEGRFCIQGKVLFHFDLPSRLDKAQASDAVKDSPEHQIKPMAVHIHDLYIGTNEDCRSIFDFFRLITSAAHSVPSK
jgi:hypothetical protein